MKDKEGGDREDHTTENKKKECLQKKQEKKRK